MENLYIETTRLWDSRSERLSEGWANDLARGVPFIERAATQFRRAKPFRYYVPLGSARVQNQNAPVTFSVRFHGQQVASLVVAPTARTLVVEESHERTNRSYFGIELAAGRYDWVGRDAAAFRRAFEEHEGSFGQSVKTRSPEHALESRILVEMEKKTRATKFDGSLHGVRHVGVTRFELPFQCPTPISASTGAPEPGLGHIDILARRRAAGRRVTLSAWELKKPKATAHAVEQAYIYAVTLVRMLRGRGGDIWYRNFGFGGRLPEAIEIEAVVAVTDDRRSAVERSARKLLASSPTELVAENAVITLKAAYYDPDTLAMKVEDLG